MLTPPGQVPLLAHKVERFHTFAAREMNICFKRAGSPLAPSPHSRGPKRARQDDRAGAWQRGQPVGARR